MPDHDEDTSSQDDVDTSASDDDTTDDAQDAAGAGDDQETSDDSDSQDDDTDSDDDSDDSDSDAGDDDSGDSSDTDDEDEDEDDNNLALTRPDLFDANNGTDKQDEPFDIRKLPRDAAGLIDPEAANRAIQEHIDKQLAAKGSQADKKAELTQLLTDQWNKVETKYPHIWKNKRLIEEAKEKHLNSIGPGKAYLSPLAATKKVAKLYNLGVKSGVKQNKSKRTVEKLTTPNRSSGKPAPTGDQTYANLKKQALSSNPAEAKQARIDLLKYRREARQGS